jgi:hypothetical protein
MWVGLRIWEDCNSSHISETSWGWASNARNMSRHWTSIKCSKSEVYIKLVVLLHNYVTMMHSQQNIKKKIDTNNYGHTITTGAGYCWLMGQYNVNWSVCPYTENKAFKIMQCWITQLLFCVAVCSELWKAWVMGEITYFRPSHFCLTA